MEGTTSIRSYDGRNCAFKKEIIGFIGLGNMRKPLVSHIIRDSFSVYVFDVNAEAMESKTKMGTAGCSSSADLASRSDIF
ncbi:MAG: NAD(P)-binding domain-containing protein [Pseudomonadota bacterium]